MKVSLFVTCSAVFLAAWLGVTFFREVPQDAYPQLGKGSLPISAKMEKKEQLEKEGRMEKTEALIAIDELAEEVVATAE